MFQYYGYVDEVVIPSKNDVWGNTYEFVHVFNVKDSKLLATKLDNILLESVKLYVNIPKFARAGKLDVNLLHKCRDVLKFHSHTGRTFVSHWDRRGSDDTSRSKYATCYQSYASVVQ